MSDEQLEHKSPNLGISHYNSLIVETFENKNNTFVRNIPWTNDMFINGPYVTGLVLNRHSRLEEMEIILNIKETLGEFYESLSDLLHYFKCKDRYSYFQINMTHIMVHFKIPNIKLRRVRLLRTNHIERTCSVFETSYCPTTKVLQGKDECIYCWNHIDTTTVPAINFGLRPESLHRYARHLNACTSLDIATEELPYVCFNTTDEKYFGNTSALLAFGKGKREYMRYYTRNDLSSRSMHEVDDEKTLRNFQQKFFECTNGLLEHFPWKEGMCVAGGCIPVLALNRDYKHFDIDIFIRTQNIHDNTSIRDIALEIVHYMKIFDSSCVLNVNEKYVIQIKFPSGICPKIDLVFVAPDIHEIVGGFDIDAVRCLYDPLQEKLMYTECCRTAWETNTVNDARHTSYTRVQKMKMKGFIISETAISSSSRQRQRSKRVRGLYFDEINDVLSAIANEKPL